MYSGDTISSTLGLREAGRCLVIQNQPGSWSPSLNTPTSPNVTVERYSSECLLKQFPCSPSSSNSILLPQLPSTKILGMYLLSYSIQHLVLRRLLLVFLWFRGRVFYNPNDRIQQAFIRPSGMFGRSGVSFIAFPYPTPKQSVSTVLLVVVGVGLHAFCAGILVRGVQVMVRMCCD